MMYQKIRSASQHNHLISLPYLYVSIETAYYVLMRVITKNNSLLTYNFLSPNTAAELSKILYQE